MVILYIDYIKYNYSTYDENLKAEYIARDKAYVASLIKDKLDMDLSNIVERWFRLDDLGYSDKNESFLDLLKEAEQLFYFGYYIGAIAIIGIASEEFAKYLYNKNISEIDHLTQQNRLNALKDQKYISINIYNKLDDIRTHRNKCIHYNTTFKTLTKDNLEHIAEHLIGQYKSVLKDLISIKKPEIKELNSELIKNKNDGMTLDELKFRYRNMLNVNYNINLQVVPGEKEVIRNEIYQVNWISSDTKELEICLVNSQGIMINVDLTFPQLKRIEEMLIKENDIVYAEIISKVSEAGMTEAFTLLDIKKIIRTV